LISLVLQKLKGEIDDFTTSILKFCKFLIQNGLLNDQELSDINDELKKIVRMKIKTKLALYQKEESISSQPSMFSVSEFKDSPGGNKKMKFKPAVLKSLKSV